ncbi:MAG: protein kinase [Sandaracinaceae bacterium]
MSLWKRLLGRRDPEPRREEPADHDDVVAKMTRLADPTTTPGASEAPEKSPEEILWDLGTRPQPDLDDAEVLEHVEALRLEGRDARAIDLARRILVHHPERLAIQLAVAELLTARGDDAGADALLSPLVDRRDASLDLWMLAAEVAQRRGDAQRALMLYERILAKDLDYPRARARVRQLREGERHQRDLGATLMADGALTRGRYRVERELGRGGAGTVFLADDLSLGRKVALKVYHRRGRAERARLLAEARMPARVEHPGVVRIFDLDEGLAAISMERVLGGSVRQELSKGSLPLARIERWLRTAADALLCIHGQRIVHRDLKPSNLLLRSDDRVVLTDFGLATESGGDAMPGAQQGEGTLAYMPPEQRAGAPARLEMDVYAFGVTVREILGHLRSEPPSHLAEIAGACMRADPAQRPSARWLLDKLGPAR